VLRIVAKLDKLAEDFDPRKNMGLGRLSPQGHLIKFTKSAPDLDKALSTLYKLYSSDHTKGNFKKKGADPRVLSEMSEHVIEIKKALKYLSSRIERLSASTDVANRAIGYDML